ncbi:hypothetical protein ABIE66_001328 [Peribacillus sp. B2I2]
MASQLFGRIDCGEEAWQRVGGLKTLERFLEGL